MTGPADSEEVEPRDHAVVARHLGREPRNLTGIAARCPFGYPTVVETAPILNGGEPNPTLLYLTCPSLASVVSRAESEGGVRKLKLSCGADEHMRDVLERITEVYRARRAELAEGRTGPARVGARLGAGIGGPEGPEIASCLHAYAAALLAVMTGWLGADDPNLLYEAHEVWARILPPLEDSWCDDARCAHWDTSPRRAIIDIGTTSVRLLVADLMDGELRPLARHAEVTRLGEGLQPGGLLRAEAKQRTADTVDRYVHRARGYGADTILLVGTSAARDALDGEEFIHTLGREHRALTAVLSGPKEAELAYAGAGLHIPGDVTVLDVGGGSTELTCRKRNARIDAVSLELGAGRATERWIKADPPTPEEIANIRQEAEEAFRSVAKRFGPSDSGVASGPDAEPRRLVGVAGTVTTLASLDAGLEEYDAELIHLRNLSVETVRELVERLSTLTTDERAALPCVQAGRAPVIVAGAVIVLAAMETLGYSELTVSERDLLDGVALYWAW